MHERWPLVQQINKLKKTKECTFLFKKIVLSNFINFFSEHSNETSIDDVVVKRQNDATSRRHLIIMWSAPRNFYLYENTLSVGLTIGPPLSSGKELYNLMYFGRAKTTFHSRSHCLSLILALLGKLTR